MVIKQMVIDEKKDNKVLLISVLISLGTGLLSALLSPQMRLNYEMANKPPLAPPGWVFGPVWIFLYIVMGIGAYKVYRAGWDRKAVRDALFFYGSQLIFNFMWSILFFRFSLPGVALLDLIILGVLVVITTIKFSSIDPVACWLMIPYMLWLIYAGVLNYGFIVENL